MRLEVTKRKTKKVDVLLSDYTYTTDERKDRGTSFFKCRLDKRDGINKFVELYEQNKSIDDVAKGFGVSSRTVYNWLSVDERVREARTIVDGAKMDRLMINMMIHRLIESAMGYDYTLDTLFADDNGDMKLGKQQQYHQKADLSMLYALLCLFNGVIPDNDKYVPMSMLDDLISKGTSINSKIKEVVDNMSEDDIAKQIGLIGLFNGREEEK